MESKREGLKTREKLCIVESLLHSFQTFETRIVFAGAMLHFQVVLDVREMPPYEFLLKIRLWDPPYVVDFTPKTSEIWPFFFSCDPRREPTHSRPWDFPSVVVAVLFFSKCFFFFVLELSKWGTLTSLQLEIRFLGTKLLEISIGSGVRALKMGLKKKKGGAPLS